MRRKTTSRKRESFVFFLFFITISACCLFTFASAQGPDLLETGSGVRLRSPDAAPSEIKIVSYNMRWRSGQTLDEIVKHLDSDPEIGRASIIGLQEADRNKKRSGYTNTARRIADQLGMYYAWAAPPLSEK